MRANEFDTFRLLFTLTDPLGDALEVMWEGGREYKEE